MAIASGPISCAAIAAAGTISPVFNKVRRESGFILPPDSLSLEGKSLTTVLTLALSLHAALRSVASIRHPMLRRQRFFPAAPAESALPSTSLKMDGCCLLTQVSAPAKWLSLLIEQQRSLLISFQWSVMGATKYAVRYRTQASRRKSKLPDPRGLTPSTRRVCTTSLFGYQSGIPGNSSARIFCTSTYSALRAV